jgi:hypothetical protein
LYHIQRVREFSASQVGGHNLTEWGWSPESTPGANLAVRELFRDSSNNPITLTLASDQALRLIYATELQLQPVNPTAVSIAVTNMGTLTGSLTWALGQPGWGRGDLDAANAFARGVGPTYAILHSGAISTSYSDTSSHSWTVRVSYSFQAYTTGSRRRLTNPILFGTAVTGSFQTYGLGWYEGSGYIQNQAPIRIVLDAAFDKDNLHKFTFDPWELSW